MKNGYRSTVHHPSGNETTKGAGLQPPGALPGLAPFSLSILIPAFNEERTIGDLLARVLSVEFEALNVGLEVIVCDDGSRDGTSAEVAKIKARDPRVKLVGHLRNRGKGSAIRTALGRATGEYVLVQDADLEYDPSEYPVLFAAVRAGAPVVYGSRFLMRRYPRGMALPNYVANRALTAMANLLFGHRLTDEATCLKLFRADVLRSLQVESTRFEFCPEVTAKLGLLGIPIVEVPVEYRARNVLGGKKVRWVDGVEALLVLLRLRLAQQRLGMVRATPSPRSGKFS